MEKAIALTESTYDRFDEAARKTLGQNREQTRANFQSPIIQYLKISAGSTNANGYPAFIQATTDAGVTWANQSGTSVRVRSLSNSVFEEGDDVFARFAGINASGEGCFIFVAFGGVSEIDVISKACKATLSGGIPDYTFEHQRFRAQGLPVSGGIYCTTDDEDCCPTVLVACCDVPLSRCYKLVFGGGAGYWACLDGFTLYLVYDEATGEWYSPSSDLGDTRSKITQCGVIAHGDGLYASARVRCVNLGDAGSALELWLEIGHVHVGDHPPFVEVCYGTRGIADPPDAESEFTLNCDLTKFIDDSAPTWTGQIVNCPPFAVDYDIDGLTGGTVDFTLSEADCDDVGDGNLTGGDPDADGCCNETRTLGYIFDGDGDFTDDSNAVTLTYNPTYITSLVDGGASTYDGRFQWYTTLDGYFFFFGCKDGVAYFGYRGEYPRRDCLGFTAHDANYWYSKAADTYTCEGFDVASLTLTGTGTAGCSGDVIMSVQRL